MRLSQSVIALFIIGAAGCSSDDPPAAQPAPAAHVEAPRPESELTTVKLSQEAVKRLGLETTVAKIDTAAATRSLGGEVTVPEGRLVTVLRSQPFAEFFFQAAILP